LGLEGEEFAGGGGGKLGVPGPIPTMNLQLSRGITLTEGVGGSHGGSAIPQLGITRGPADRRW